VKWLDALRMMCERMLREMGFWKRAVGCGRMGCAGCVLGVMDDKQTNGAMQAGLAARPADAFNPNSSGFYIPSGMKSRKFWWPFASILLGPSFVYFPSPTSTHTPPQNSFRPPSTCCIPFDTRAELDAIPKVPLTFSHPRVLWPTTVFSTFKQRQRHTRNNTRLKRARPEQKENTSQPFRSILTAGTLEPPPP
jgi:hypothetical protein